MGLELWRLLESGHANDASYMTVISDEIIISDSDSEIKVWDVESGTV